jgi:hypothetical protein
MDRKLRHPSDKPIRRDRETRLGFTRRPHDEPLTPGLRRREGASAIGFLADIANDREEDCS